MAGRSVASLLLVGLTVALAACSTPPAGHTDAELQEYVDLQNLSQWTAMFPSGSEPPPAVRVERFINRSESDVPWHCMADAGVPVTFGDGGAVSWTTLPEGQDATNLVLYECQAKFPIYPPQDGFLTDEQREYLYDYYQSVLVPCLALEGYPITGAAPSRAAFTDVTRVDSFWTPYSFIEYPVSSNDQADLLAKCPDSPFHAPVSD